MITKAMRFVIRHPAGEDGSENGGGAAEVAEGAEGAGESGKADDGGESDDVEAEAIAMGWKPKDQFKGDQSKWTPAAEFVERGKNILPMVQARVERQNKRIADLERTAQDLAKVNAEAEKRGYERAMKEAKEQRKAAIADGDAEAFEAADERIEDLRKKTEAVDKKVKQAPGPDPEYQEWEERNPWMQTPEMAEYAEFIGQKLRREGDNSSGLEFLNKLTAKVKAQFPDKFKNPRRESAPAVEGGTPSARKGGRTYNDLPADAKAACDRMMKNGFPGDDKAAKQFKDEFVKNYEWE